MIYGSVCSGIEAASVAWHPLGWQAAFVSEIEAFPRAVLSERFPEIPLHGDFTTIGADDYRAIDLLVGGTPCQSFSIAGLRGGMADERGNLSLEYLRLAGRLGPRWLVWENVPGVLSSNGGRDFGSILGGLVELGYGFAYRVLDAQYFGVPQRRRRVFVVGYLGDWRPAAAVLFERASLRRDPAPGRGQTEDVAGTIAGGARSSGYSHDDIPMTAGTLDGAAGGADENDAEQGRLVAPVADCLTANWDRSKGAKAGNQVGLINPVIYPTGVRRLTPRECERLQGFPDDYTSVRYRNKPAADGPRYKALGNSMAVPVMAWIGRRIEAVEQILAERKAA